MMAWHELLWPYLQVIEHVAAALGKDPRDVKQINFLKPPEQVLVRASAELELLRDGLTTDPCHLGSINTA